MLSCELFWPSLHALTVSFLCLLTHPDRVERHLGCPSLQALLEPLVNPINGYVNSMLLFDQLGGLAGTEAS